MENIERIKEFDEMKNLSACVKKFIEEYKYKECEEMISYTMYLHPHNPEPHNLLGILMEKRGDHVLAMKHFRASLDLDPTYKPAQTNLEVFGTFFASKKKFCYV